MPKPEPIGAASGITAAQPMSWSFFAVIGIVGDVGQNDESFLDQNLGRIEGGRNIRE